MYQFFIQPDNITEDDILITDAQDVNHIKNVLRMKKGGETCSLLRGDRKRVSLCCGGV